MSYISNPHDRGTIFIPDVSRAFDLILSKSSRSRVKSFTLSASYAFYCQRVWVAARGLNTHFMTDHTARLYRWSTRKVKRKKRGNTCCIWHDKEQRFSHKESWHRRRRLIHRRLNLCRLFFLNARGCFLGYELWCNR